MRTNVEKMLRIARRADACEDAIFWFLDFRGTESVSEILDLFPEIEGEDWREWWYSLMRIGADIHPTAKVSHRSRIYPGAKIGENASVGPFSIIFQNSVVGENSSIGEGTIIDYSVIVGRDVLIGDWSILRTGAIVGNNSRIMSDRMSRTCIESESIVEASSRVDFGRTIENSQKSLERGQ